MDSRSKMPSGEQSTEKLIKIELTTDEIKIIIDALQNRFSQTFSPFSFFDDIEDAREGIENVHLKILTSWKD